MKTTKGGKVMNPTDAYRKELRKKELKRNKKERKKVREVGILKKDPDTLKEQIEKLEMMKADGALDKARKHKKRQLEDTLSLVLKKRREYEEKQKEKGETPVMFSHLGPLTRRTNAEDDIAKHPMPEDSVYYHPTLNPTGAPPPGKPPMYKSSIAPRISEVASSGVGSSSNAESEDVALAVPPPPLPSGGDLESGDASAVPLSFPLPPPPPTPSKPPAADLGQSLPPPPPLAGAPPTDQVTVHPPPPPLQQSIQPPPPGTGVNNGEKIHSSVSDKPISDVRVQASSMLHPPPPPPGLPMKPPGKQFEGGPSESDANNLFGAKDLSRMVPPPPPPRQMQGSRPPMMPTLQPDLFPLGMANYLPPPPPPVGIPSQAALPGMMVPLIPRPPPGPLSGPPPMMRPPLPPGPPPIVQDEDHAAFRPQGPPQKPSYVKSAASTVVKRPLAQHTPELTSMVPASVRVRREAALPKAKPKPLVANAAPAVQPLVSLVSKPESAAPSAGPKSHSIDDSYSAFLEDMKALGALDS